MSVDLLAHAFVAILTLSFDDFSWFGWLLFPLLLYIGYRIADVITSTDLIYGNSFEKIKSHRVLKDEDLTMTDHFYTVINRCISTPMYIYHTTRFVTQSESVKMFDKSDFISENPLSLLATHFIQFLLLFLIYDLIYYFFHRTLHIRSIYGYIHKHHHRQVSPFRGTYDGINTHPFEFLFGIYLHLNSVIILTYMFNDVHFIAMMAFFLLAAMMASWNHTRYAICIPHFYNVKDHDVHHRYPTANYGQFVMFWDVLFGSFLTHEQLANKWKNK